MEFAITLRELGILSFGSLIAGIYLLVLSGDWTITASVAIAKRANLSKMFIGATIIAFGTSIPELVTSVNANLRGYPGIALGNIVGSNICNILLVVGAAALFHTLRPTPAGVQRDLAMMLLATAILVGGMLAGAFTFWMGLLMFLVMVGFVVWQYLNNETGADEIDAVEAMPIPKALAIIVAALIGLAAGAELLVVGAVKIGAVAGVPEAIVGLTAVAVGTSLPELSSSIAAAIRRETDLVFGNIIGSNTFNILAIIGVTAMTKTLPVDASIAGFDMWFMAAIAVGFTIWLMAAVPIGRVAGLIFLASYTAYTLYLFGGPIGQLFGAA